MSLGKRLWDMARSNITDFRSALKPDALDGLSDEERRALDEELAETVGAKAGRTARKFKDAAEEAWEKAFEAAQARGGGGFNGGRPSPEAERLRWYRTLELEPGADHQAIRKAYRRLLVQYHPDKFAKDPEKYKAATEVTRNVTAAYDGLTALLGG